MTSEAIKTLCLGEYGEAGVVVIVKRTKTNKVITVLFEFNILSDKFFKRNALFKRIDKLSGKIHRSALHVSVFLAPFILLVGGQNFFLIIAYYSSS